MSRGRESHNAIAQIKQVAKGQKATIVEYSIIYWSVSLPQS
jgi:hypothetical protein